MATVKELKESLADMPDDRAVAWSLWHVEDVMSLYDQLTLQEAEQVLEAVHRQQDASIGINWDVLQTHIGLMLADRTIP